METWYAANYATPYPTAEVIHQLATETRLTVCQVRKWLANRRVRSYNTLAYNQSILPKRERRRKKARPDLSGSASQYRIEGNVNVSPMFGPGIALGQGIMNPMNRTSTTSTMSPGSLFAGNSRVRHGLNDAVSSLPGASFASELSSIDSSHAPSMYLQRSLDVDNSNLNLLRINSLFFQQPQHPLTIHYDQSGF